MEIRIGSEGMGIYSMRILNNILKKMNYKCIIYRNNREIDFIVSSFFYGLEPKWNKLPIKYIFWSGEPCLPPFNNISPKYLYILTHKPNNFNNNYIYIPFVLNSPYINLDRKYKNSNRKYLLAYCNSNKVNNREEIFNIFVEKTDINLCHSFGKCYGKYKNTSKDTVKKTRWEDKKLIDVYKDYKFVIAMENCKLSGYVTEKILNAFYSGAIPIYYGCDEINNYFNKDAFINVSNFKSLQDCVNYVINLSEEEIIKMQNQPFYNKTNEVINLFNNNLKKNKTLDRYINYLEFFLKKKIHLITYGDLNFYGSKRTLLKEAKDTVWFNTLSSYGPDDIDKEYKLKYKDILSNSKGGGYWIWKNYFIRKKLNEIDEGDILIYMDAGCGINIKGYKRFFEYMNILKDNDIIAFQMNHHIEKYWTTNEIFEYFNADDNIKNSGQIIATVKIIKKNKDTVNLFNLEDKVYRDNKLLVTDFYNSNQSEYFRDNSHDQSIYSILIKKYKNVFILNDKTYFKNFKNEDALKEPFHALKRKIKYSIQNEILFNINNFISYLMAMIIINKKIIRRLLKIFLIYYFLGFLYVFLFLPIVYNKKIKKIINDYFM